MARGYIYILFNASLRRNQFKIGLTTGTPENRARELSRATGVPQPYEVAYSVFVEDCAAAERIVHQHLAEHRINKEFFELPLAVAVRAVEDAAAKVGRANIDETPKESSAEITSVPAQATEFEFGTPEKSTTRRATQSVGPIATQDMSVEDHAQRTDASRREILVDLRAKVLALGADVTERVTPARRIAYSRSRVFLEVKVDSDRIRVLFLDFPLEDPRAIVERVPATHGWGRLRNLINLRSMAD